MKITCRVCIIQQGEFFTLDSTVPFYGRKEEKLLDMYNKCLQLHAAPQDALPQVVCAACFEKIIEFFEFQLKAEKSYHELSGNIPGTISKGESNEFLTTDNDKNVGLPHSENIQTEDELDHIEENYDGWMDGDDEEDETEDTDILFELYSKNDSCMEKYLKCEKIELENVNGEEIDDIDDNEIKFNQPENFEKCEKIDFDDVNEEEIDDIDDKKMKLKQPENNNVPLDKKSSDELGTVLETELSSIEISRIEIPNPQVQTILLEPLVEMRKWKCSDCGRKYLTEEKLEQHRKLHKQSENCQCEICGSSMESLYDYGVHMKIHGKERKFSCEFCDKTFSTRAKLKAHIYIHSNLRPFKCEMCGKAFQQKSILKTHMTLHTGKPFECTLCHRRFSRTAHLNIHMRQHNNVRPYQCSHCQSSYMQKSHLDRHISSSHLGVRYQCTICNKMYTKKPSLNNHMREAHCATVSLYNCEICDLDFPKQKALYYHLKSKHPNYKKN